MCGFVGILQQPILSKKAVISDLACMTDTLVHRGPDDAGVWVDERICISFGHRRLAVLDLSAAGHQPMFSGNIRYVIVYNGEIYNFSSLKKELETITDIYWRGHSDTEILLAAIEEWGVEKTLSKLVGMFAFALWDLKEETLYLARDRMGEKPLYYGINNKMLFFGSELKAFQPHPKWKGQINQNALGLLLQYGYIPAPFSIYQNILKLLPGTFLKISNRDGWLTKNELPEPISYWSFIDIAKQSASNPFSDDPEEIVEELERILTKSVASQMIADVPLGAFLSGGIDSSLITALMQANSSKPVKTFTIGFHENEFNEAKFAKAVSEHLGTEHTELYLNPKEALNIIPELAEIYDEPFADASQIATLLVARLARQEVTVGLTGDGGDELFSGYTCFTRDPRRWSFINKLSPKLRNSISLILRKTPYLLFDLLLLWTRPFRPCDGGRGSYASSLLKFGKELQCKNFVEFYNFRESMWKETTKVVLNSQKISPISSILHTDNEDNIVELVEYMMSFNTIQYLPDDILVKVDRAAMATSLETRIPLLDHRLVEFAWKIPLSIKMYNGEKKWPLKKLLYKFVPESLANRPKKGFSLPIGTWLRGPLREWCEEMLDSQYLNDGGYFFSPLIRKKWEEHLVGKHNHAGSLWTVLMFQAWLKHNKL
jgi:asparagine synthase (glutamine-hydrolysing)